MAEHWLPIDNPRHTEVLGNRCTSKYGKADWARLNWSEWWMDRTGAEGHLFSVANNTYFHVPIADVPDDPADGRVYRVRCWYAGGTYRGKAVESVSIGCNGGKLHWIVRTKD